MERTLGQRSEPGMHRHSLSHGKGGPLELECETKDGRPNDIPLQDLQSSPQSASSTSRDWQSLSPRLNHNVEVEAARLLEDDVDDKHYSHDESLPRDNLNFRQLSSLYTTHTLSMWNSRSYEFASVLFTTSAYPNTLLVASLRGLSANLASLLFSSSLGRWCNRHPSRLRTLQICIIGQRICICIACLGWTLIVHAEGSDQNVDDDASISSSGSALITVSWLKHVILAALLLLGMLEKLSWVGNLIIVERDWLPRLASPTSKPALHTLNAGIERIDLISKLVAPLAVSAVELGVHSLRVTTLLIAVMQIVTIAPELWLAREVWRSSAALQSSNVLNATSSRNSSLESTTADVGDTGFVRGAAAEKDTLGLRKVIWWSQGFQNYARSPVFAPSLARALQPLSVLILSASMTIYLLVANFPLEETTIARTASTGIEILSTVITPLMISRLARGSEAPTAGSEMLLKPLTIVGLAGLLWQVSILIPAVVALSLLPSTASDPAGSFPALTFVLYAFLALSRLGPFAYTLVEQQLVQMVVPPHSRIEFSGCEMALVSFSELLRWTLMSVFEKPGYFKAIAIFSWSVLAGGAVLFWLWSRTWREKSSGRTWPSAPPG